MTADRSIDLIGVPFNSHGTTDGVARAPGALRRAGLVRALRDAGASVRDVGDLALEAGGAVRDERSGIIAPVALATMIRSVREAVGASLERGSLPLVLGGDCPVLIGCLGAASAAAHPPGRGPGLLFIDGHEDAWPPLSSTTGEAADMELGLLLGIGSADLPAELRREIPSPHPDAVTIVGARDRAELEEASIRSVEDRVDMVRPEDLAGDRVDAAERAIARLAERGPWWLHVDLDVLSTASLAAVDYPQPGGLEWPLLTAIAGRALQEPTVIGWDVTIYNPDLDPDRVQADRIVQFIADTVAWDGRLA